VTHVQLVLLNQSALQYMTKSKS